MNKDETKKWKKAVFVGITLVVVGLLATAAWVLRPWDLAEAAQSGEITGLDGQKTLKEADLVTAPVQRQTLTEQLRLSGTLNYGDPVALPVSPGMITGLPAAGQSISTGQKLYEMNGTPVTLMRGSRPFWRDLSPGVPDGEDIRQLHQNLSDMGYYYGAIGVKYDDWTVSAVKRWQKDLGIEQTGDFTPSLAAIVDAPSVRIARLTGELGQSGVSPATYTKQNMAVSVPLSDDQATRLSAGQKVQIDLSDGKQVAGTIDQIKPGQAASDGKEATKPQAIITPDNDAELDGVEPGSVRVTIGKDGASEATLVVPAVALVAAADGTYQLDLLRDGKIIRVPVNIGLVADSKVQILGVTDEAKTQGLNIDEGDKVVLSQWSE